MLLRRKKVQRGEGVGEKVTSLQGEGIKSLPVED